MPGENTMVRLAWVLGSKLHTQQVQIHSGGGLGTELLAPSTFLSFKFLYNTL